MMYENPELQRKARSCIPHQQMSSAAERKLKEAKEADPGEIFSLIQKIQSYCVLLLNKDSEGPTDFLSCL